MKRSDSLDHEDLVVDCSFTKVFATRVGALGASFARTARPGDFSCFLRDKQVRDDSSAADDDIYVLRFPQAKLREFTLKELEKATSNFSSERMIGRGGFGRVFKGTLSDGTVVAVKVLAKGSGLGLEQFLAEVTTSCTIMSGSHPNLVPTIGYHSSGKGEKTKAMIVYPFMTNGDVGRYFNYRQPPITPLDWPTRKRIALGVATGISRMHELGIVHHDIKPMNVLLDEDFNAFVGDLGIARYIGLPRDSYNTAPFHYDKDGHTCVTTVIRGTIGYMAPEYCARGHCSIKTDVFAFGVTLFQLVTGISSAKFSEEGESKSIFGRAAQLIRNGENLSTLIHPSMSSIFDEREALELVQLGLICMHYDHKERPLMPEVIAIMEGNNTTLKQRWDNYDHTQVDRMYIETDYDTLSNSTLFSHVGAGGSDIGDDEEGRCTNDLDINKKEHGENGENNMQLLPEENLPSEESIEEHRAGNDQHQPQGHPFGVSHFESLQTGDSNRSKSVGLPPSRLTGLASRISLGNDALAEIEAVDQNERGNLERLSSGDNGCEANSEAVATKLKEMLDQVREMELNYQAAMEEMHQKQMEIMQSMIKMREEYIQKINQMQLQIDQLKEEM